MRHVLLLLFLAALDKTTGLMSIEELYGQRSQPCAKNQACGMSVPFFKKQLTFCQCNNDAECNVPGPRQPRQVRTLLCSDNPKIRDCGENEIAETFGHSYEFIYHCNCRSPLWLATYSWDRVRDVKTFRCEQPKICTSNAICAVHYEAVERGKLVAHTIVRCDCASGQHCRAGNVTVKRGETTALLHECQ